MTLGRRAHVLNAVIIVVLSTDHFSLGEKGIVRDARECHSTVTDGAVP